ncbi:MAG: hypothetical protein O2992_12470, partial [Gemmatimonadetes bacterium]|nr:hypothetical protein [Gemmatimonadota bacterium]
MTSTTIQCTTCASTVPWGPHCPSCGAYLEFAGDPPWRPAPEGVEPLEPTADGTPEADAEQTPAPEVISVRTAEATPEGPPTQLSPAMPRRGSFAGTIGVLVTGAVTSPLIWWAVGPLLGVATAIVFLMWALVLWPRRVDFTFAEPPAPVGVEVGVEVGEAASVGIVTDMQEEPGIQARPPQALARRTVETTRPLTTMAIVGDVPCPVCERLSISSRSYCQWCGEPMANASLGPDTVPFIESDTPEAAQRKQKRRLAPTRSWRNAIIALTLVGALLSSVILVVFGPGAFRFRFGMTSVYQLINQFIDPYAGKTATIDTATASSSLPGSPPRDTIGLDATTFWASQPSSFMGAGNFLDFTFSGQYTINRMVIAPGIQNQLLDTRAVATPREITLTFDDGSTASTELELIEGQS